MISSVLMTLMDAISAMRIAIVHDWLIDWAGAEKVLALLLARFPRAEVFTIVDFLDDRHREPLAGHSVHTSFIQRLPGARRHYRSYLPLMPLAIEQFDLKGFDLVISSSHAVAKGVIPDPNAIHLCYCYSPMRYAWDMQHQYLRQTGNHRGIKGKLIRWQLHRLRQWDFISAQRVDHFIAISHYIERRIQRCYRRESEVIYPPVAIENFRHDRPREEFYLTASRLVPYKRIDLVIKAFNYMPDKRLIVIGDGPERKRLTALAGPNVTLMGYQEDLVLVDHLERTRAFIFMAEEDFGILPVEAQAAGAPVIGYGIGGVAETVVDGKTGIHVKEQNIDSLCRAVRQLETLLADVPGIFDPSDCRDNAQQFGRVYFERQLEMLLNRFSVNASQDPFSAFAKRLADTSQS